MRVRLLTAAALTAAFFLPTGHARAGDTHRLNLGADDAPTLDLKVRPGDAEAENELAFYRGRGIAWGGGFRGGWGGGWRGGWGGGVAWRGGWGGHWGHGVGWRGGWGGYGWNPRFVGGIGGFRVGGWGGFGYGVPYSVGYPVYSYPVYSAPVYSYYTPCVAPSVSVQVQTLRYPVMPSADSLPPTTVVPRGVAPPAMPKAGGTYEYDGGPSNPVPLPPPTKDEIMTRDLPRLPTLMGGIPVSVNAGGKPAAKWEYPAYGEKPSRSR